MDRALPDPRAIRIAENESRFREVNERLEGDLRQYASPGERLDFVCECGKQSCEDTIALTVEEYEHVRRESRDFAVVPGHELTDVEDVVADRGGYLVVRKHPPTAGIVEDADPRRVG